MACTDIGVAAEDTKNLVYELQKCAYDAGHPVPLAIAIDQENGGVNSLFDEIYIRQYPSAMGLAATGSTDLAYEVAKATAEEIATCGVNWIFGKLKVHILNAVTCVIFDRPSGRHSMLVRLAGV